MTGETPQDDEFEKLFVGVVPVVVAVVMVVIMVIMAGDIKHVLAFVVSAG